MSTKEKDRSQALIDDLTSLEENSHYKKDVSPDECLESKEPSEKQLAAEDLISRGFKVFPLHRKILGNDCTCKKYGCPHQGKEPVFTGGFYNASNKLDDIDAWWSENPNWNIGIRMGDGLITLDVDGLEGEQLIQSEEIRLRQKLPKTLTSQTGRGYHLIFSFDSKMKLTDSLPAHWKKVVNTKIVSKGVDIRGDGGYIVGPGSDHYSGKKYHFVDPSTPIAPLPPAWVKMLSEIKPPVQEPAPATLNNDISGKLKEHDGRDNAVSREVYKIRKSGIKGDLLFQNAQEINKRICHPDHLLPDARLRAMCDSKERLVSPDPIPIIAPKVDTKTTACNKNLLSIDRATEFFSQHGIGCGDLMSQELPPLKYTVEKILPEGLTLYIGAPKVGKSLFCLDMAISVSNGTKLFGQFETEAGVVLYLALEDGNRRLQYRIKKMTDQFSNRLKLFTRWGQINSRGDLDAVNLLEHFLEVEPETNLVIVDTLGKLSLEQKANGDIYGSDVKRLEGLQQLALEKHISILLVHHTNKGDHKDEHNRASGSHGLDGTADQLWILDRSDRHEAEATLSISGRDVEPIRAALEFDANTLTWKWVGIAKERDNRKIADRILDAIQDQGKPLSQSKLAEITGIKLGSIKSGISRLHDTGKIRQAAGQKGKYVVAPGGPIAYM